MRSRTPSPLSLAWDQLRASREGPAGLARRRQARLEALVRHARRHSPFYEELYREVPAGRLRLSALQTVDKPTLMGAFDRWVTDPAVTLAGISAFVADPGRAGQLYQGRYFVATTSGTTGEPGVFVDDAHARAVYRSISYLIDLDWLSLPQWVDMARLRGRWSAVVGSGGHYAGAAWMEHQRQTSRWRSHHQRVIPAQQPVPALVDQLNAFDPAVLTSYPSVLKILAAEQRAGRLRIRPVIIEASGESLDTDDRRLIHGGLGGALHEVYAATEFLIIARDCRAGRLHLNEDWVILEPVDSHGRPTPAGEPSDTVLLTSLANRVQPLIRYDLGDSVLVSPQPCPCGNPRRVIRVEGRHDDVLHLPAGDGTVVALAPLPLGSTVDEVPGALRSQLVQASPSVLRLRVAVTPGSQVEEVRRQAHRAVTAYLAKHGVAGVEVLLDEEPPSVGASGKFRQVIGVTGGPAPQP